jgi:hypothetical protein
MRDGEGAVWGGPDLKPERLGVVGELEGGFAESAVHDEEEVDGARARAEDV